MKLAEIRNLAESFAKAIYQDCDRIEIAGSIRREKAEPKDVEIVAIPKYIIRENLFGQEIGRVNQAFKYIRRKRNADGAKAGFDIVKGSSDCPKYVQLQVHNGPKIDIFFATPENWGWILFIRTGPKAWNIKAVQELKRRGYGLKDGRIFDDRYTRKAWTNPLAIMTEEVVFDHLGWDWVEPRDRA